MSTLLAILIPPLAVIALAYILDKHDREPVKMLLKGFAIGMVSYVPVLMFRTMFELYTGIYDLDLASDTAAYIAFHLIGVGFISCVVKAVALYFFIWKDPTFDHTFDGIVYSITIAMGCAVFDNARMIFSDPSRGDLLVNALIYVPASAAFAVIMGFFFSKAKMASLFGDTKDEAKNLALCALVPGIMQGIYSAFTGSDSDISSLLSFFYVVALALTVFMLVRKELVDNSQFYDVSFYEMQGRSSPDPIAAMGDMLRSIESRGERKAFDNSSIISDFNKDRPEGLDDQYKPTKEQRFNDALENAYSAIMISGSTDLARDIYSAAYVSAAKKGIIEDDTIKPAAADTGTDTAADTSETAGTPINITEGTQPSTPDLNDGRPWTCKSCGAFNMLTFCVNCGKKRTDE